MHSKLVKMLNYLSKHILMFICIKKKKKCTSYESSRSFLRLETNIIENIRPVERPG